MNWINACGCVVGAVVLAALAQTSVAGGIVIDDFHQGAVNLDVYDGFDSDSTIQGLLLTSSVIGGERRCEADWTDGPGDGTVRINRRSSGTFDFSEDAATSGKAVLDYGYSNDLNADLAAVGGAFQFTFTWADLVGALNIIVSTSGMGSSTATIATPSNLFSGSVNSVVDFSSFTVLTGTGADFNDIDKIHVEIVGHDGGDYTLTGIDVVPEPATLALLATGGCLTLWRRRRR
jgi:hypothetical protein